MNALLNFEFSDKYLTPHGMIVHDDGLTFQQLTLGFFNIYKGEKLLNDFTLVDGVWNDFSSKGVSENAPFGSRNHISRRLAPLHCSCCVVNDAGRKRCTHSSWSRRYSRPVGSVRIRKFSRGRRQRFAVFRAAGIFVTDSFLQ